MQPSPTLTARVVSSVVLQKDSKTLVLFEPDDSGKRRFNLPGGHVEPRESVLEAAVREVREETGLEITIGSLLQIVSSTWDDRHTVRQTFVGKIVSGELKSEEGSEILWMSQDEMNTKEDDEVVFGVKEAITLAYQQKYINAEQVIIRKRGEVQKFS